MKESVGKHVLLLVENASVPNDMRVWKEAKAVKEMGFDVSVISPRGTRVDTEQFVLLDGIEIFRYKQLVIGGGFVSYVVEYLNALFFSAMLIFRISLRRRIHAFHVANPPDLFFVIIYWFRLFGAKYIFDVHDLFVNTFESKYLHHHSMLKRAFISLLRMVERSNIACADLVVATNASYQDYLLQRYQLAPGKVFIVRNAPQLDRRIDVAPDPLLKKGRKYLLVFFGNMGEDDGVEVILQSVHYMIEERGFSDFLCSLIGPTEVEASPAIVQLQELHQKLNLTSHIEFTGYLPWRQVHKYLRTADVGLSPDPLTPQNNLSTMQKIMEYMSHGLPIVSFDLKENHYSAGDSAVYCKGYDYREFGDSIIAVLEDLKRRENMSDIGLQRYKSAFNWSCSEKILAEVYSHV